MRLMLDLVTIRRATLEQKLRIAATTGFSAVELWAEDVDAVPPDELLRQCAQHGLEIEGVCPPPALHRWHAEWDAELESALQSRFATAAHLGARYFVLPVMNDSGTLGTLERNLARACELATAFDGLDIALEPIGHIRKLCRLEPALAVLARLNGYRNLRLLLDAFHFFRGGNRLALLSAIDPRLIASVQICDALPLPLEELVGYRHRTYPGQGAFDVEGFCRALHSIDYRGPYVVEILIEEVWRADPGVVARAAFESARALLARATSDPLASQEA